jgi:hypothetical protein
MIYAEKYDDLLSHAEGSIQAAREATQGDLWQAKIDLNTARKCLEDAEALLIEVSKVAFERVLKKG